MQSQETVTWVAVTRTVSGFDTTFVDAAGVDLLALVAARLSQEADDSATPHATVGYTLYILDPSIVPGADDWFTIRGVRCDVDGPAFLWGHRGVQLDVKRAAS